MVKFKGTTAPKNFRQYMPNKLTKRAFKLWCVSAFTYKIKLFRGGVRSFSPQMKASRHTTTSLTDEIRSKHRITEANEELAKQKQDIKTYGRSRMVIIDLIEGVPKGSHIFVDNYFGSLALLHRMNLLDYELTCTLRSNRVKNCPIKSEKIMIILSRVIKKYGWCRQSRYAMCSQPHTIQIQKMVYALRMRNI